MLKYDSLNIISNSSSCSSSGIPRNLTYKYANSGINSTITDNSTSTTTNQSSANFTTATITDLSIGSLSAFGNTLNPFIVFDAAVAFSLFKSEYANNDFRAYPILFTRDIFINNNNLTMNTNSLIIKDNVIQINSQVQNNTITGSTSDVFISGIIFPIIDKNSSTGNFSGLLYIPNLKIDKVSSTSNDYNWTNNKYSYFSNTDKGFYKLKYLANDLDFTNYQNNMDSNYVDLFDNNNNLSNLIVGGLGITDGELVAFNNEFLNINIGYNPVNIITINKTNLSLHQNIDILFQSSLNLKTLNNIYLNLSNNLITFNNDLVLSKNQSTINFKNNLFISSNNQNFININNANSRIEFLKDVLINSLTIVNNLQINFPNLVFNNQFNIGSNIDEVFVPFINFTNTTDTESINLLVTTNANNLIINNSLSFLSTAIFIFNTFINFNSSEGATFFNISTITQRTTFIQPVYINNLTISSSITLINDLPINVINNFILQDSNKNILSSFNATYSSFFNDIYLNKYNPQLIFDDENTLNINSLNPLIKLQVNQSSIVISGPKDSTSTSTNVIVSSSLNVTNIGCTYVSGLNSFNYTPVSKLFISSGSTIPNQNITFVFQNLFSLEENTVQFSGKLNITSRSPDSNPPQINIYDINIWSTPNSTIEISPNPIVPINTNNIGNWGINNISLQMIYITSTTNLVINCNGSPSNNVIWALKIDGLSI
jgi:hypothetical protein